MGTAERLEAALGDRYRIQRELGEGGMATVFLAHRHQSGAPQTRLCYPQYHRIHHSIEPRHQDKNFGVLLTVWDRLFGTMNRNYDEYPATGVIGLEFDPPRRFAPLAWLRDFLRMFLHPFRALRTQDTRKVMPVVPRILSADR